VERVDYREWRQWPDDQIRAYAAAIAKQNGLSLREADSTARQMIRQGELWREAIAGLPSKVYDFPRKLEAKPEYVALFEATGDNPKSLFFSYNQKLNEASPIARLRHVGFPDKYEPSQENVFRARGYGDEEIYRANQRLNAPDRPHSKGERISAETLVERVKEYTYSEEGWGLNRRNLTRWRPKKIPKWMHEERKHARKRLSRNPFLAVKMGIQNFLEEARWLLNCLPLGVNEWWLPRQAKGYGDPLYFLETLERLFTNTQRQIEQGNAGGAALQAYRLGFCKSSWSSIWQWAKSS
jgi:hypothetical protein